MGRQGFSAERLGRIDRHLQEKYVGRGLLPGAQLILARRGEVVHESVLGLADMERGRGLEADALYRIYSMTKPITSIALMMLVEEGRIALDDPVDRWIPEWKNLGVYVAGGLDGWLTKPCDRPMQVVDLMRHTSGLTYFLQNRTTVDYAYRKTGVSTVPSDLTLEAQVAVLAALPLDFSPGEAWNYSVSTDIVGYLVQVVSGQPFQDFLRTRILDPLGMHETDFQVPAGQQDRLTACYNIKPRGLELQDDPETSPFLAPPSFYSGGGGLVSTAADYLKFAQMLVNRGQLNGVRIVSPATLRLMATNHLPGGRDLTQMSISLFSEATNAGVGFGLGFAVVFDPAKTLVPGSRGEFYWGGAASTFFWIDPVEELCAVFMTQALPSSAYPVRRELRTLVYAALEETNA
ncbi:MAG: serine hydrolase domain-containing protein [Phenylobacterium sp.]